MCCDFYIEKSLVIEYVSLKGNICKIIINKETKKGYIHKYVKGSEKYTKKLGEKIAKLSYVKMIYEKKQWTKDKYITKYESKLKKRFPEIRDFIKIYKDATAWSK